MAWTQGDLDTLKKAYATGALRVELPSAGTVTYRSLDEMRAIMKDIATEIGAEQGLVPVRRIKFVMRKDL